jgi:hypothetical protein
VRCVDSSWEHLGFLAIESSFLFLFREPCDPMTHASREYSVERTRFQLAVLFTANQLVYVDQGLAELKGAP